MNEIPEYLKNCPITSDWVEYKNKVYFADLNFEESEKIKKPVFDLAYCATKALNRIFLKEGVVYDAKTMKLTDKAN